jgi:hypothetical protein
MRYKVGPVKIICYVEGNECSDFELSFIDSTDEKADAFSVYEIDSDGCLNWVADFGNKETAENWARVMAEQK